jgi:2,4-dienoyl-CoA reductase-like NADH-dependent reductase (Old Yellow Enzyme family)
VSDIDIVQVKRLRTLQDLRDRLHELGIHDRLGVDDDVEPDGPLARPFTFADASAGAATVGNRFAVLPMEGWDGEADGSPSDLVRRRWRRFGESGAKLVWGGEAVAVRPDARANPRQLVIGPETAGALAELRAELVTAHVHAHGSADDLVVGLQLTHSGRWSRPAGPVEPKVAYRHPVLDARAPGGAVTVLTDDDLDRLVETFAEAAVLAADAGFDFVDVKHCHGYLLHELLSGVARDGRYGGTFAARTMFFRRIVERVRTVAPALAIGVRLSVYDFVPFEPGPDGAGVPVTSGGSCPFGGDGSGTGVDLTETHRFLDLCTELGIGLVCTTAGSPYYNPHIQRPAFFPPSDGYRPPNDPLVDAARMITATAELARAHPGLAVVGSGYSYLQQWLAHAAQHAVRTGATTSVGIGRGMLSYPHLPADVLAGRELERGLLCRTFSDCTTAPRNGMVSGCYPLDEFYKARPERVQLAAVKKAARRNVR